MTIETDRLFEVCKIRLNFRYITGFTDKDKYKELHNQDVHGLTYMHAVDEVGGGLEAVGGGGQVVWRDPGHQALELRHPVRSKERQFYKASSPYLTA